MALRIYEQELQWARHCSWARKLCFMPAQSAASAVEDDVNDDGDVYYNSAEDAGAYCTAKLTFFRDFLVKVWGVYYTYVRII